MDNIHYKKGNFRLLIASRRKRNAFKKKLYEEMIMKGG